MFWVYFSIALQNTKSKVVEWHQISGEICLYFKVNSTFGTRVWRFTKPRNILKVFNVFGRVKDGIAYFYVLAICGLLIKLRIKTLFEIIWSMLKAKSTWNTIFWMFKRKPVLLGLPSNLLFLLGAYNCKIRRRLGKTEKDLPQRGSVADRSSNIGAEL